MPLKLRSRCACNTLYYSFIAKIKMIKNLFLQNKYESAAPEGQRIYAIGDIHGRLDLLIALLEKIEIDSETAPDGVQLVFLGDYIDRGPDSAKVVDYLTSFEKQNSSAQFLLGNHEDTMLKFMELPGKYEDWLHWGGDATLESYGVGDVWRREAADLSAELKEKIDFDHLDFLARLKPYYEAGDFIFVHAGIKPGVALDAQQKEDLLWIRGEFHNASKEDRPKKTVVHGHHPTKKPVNLSWRIGVDTGAVFSGSLTAIVLEEKSRRFITT